MTSTNSTPPTPTTTCTEPPIVPNEAQSKLPKYLSADLLPSPAAMGFSASEKLHRNSRKPRVSSKRRPEAAFSTEEELEEMLLTSLEMLYAEAVSRLVSLGYDEDLVLRSLLRNGHCYGTLDVLTNVMDNTLAFINSGAAASACRGGFACLLQLHEYTLAGMVCLLQQVRPALSRAEAMWCLLMSDLDLARATAVEMPNRPPGSALAAARRGALGSNRDGARAGWGVVPDFSPAECGLDDQVMMDIAMVHAGDIECPKRFNLSPKMESLLKRNVAMFAAGFKAKGKNSQAKSNSGHGEGIDVKREARGVDSVLEGMGSLSVKDEKEGQVAQRDEMIFNLLNQVKELEVQVKERRDWAHEKALQAAKKLSNDLTELKMLRMERDETLALKKGKQQAPVEDVTLKKLTEMENSLKKASSQVDVANAAIRRLQNENAEMRAEREASRLSASESVHTCLEVAKREKKCLKRILNWEKQKVKLDEEIKKERDNIMQLQHQIMQVTEAQKEIEARLKQEVKEKGEALASVERERRARKASEVKVKQNQEALEQKIEIDFQRHKDDIQRLEQELSRLKASAELTQLSNPTNLLLKQDLARNISRQTRKEFQPQVTRQDTTKTEGTGNRKCVICTKNEVSVVLLPCTHQVLCVECNKSHAKAYRVCPCCHVRIDRRILVYGASS